MFGKKVIILSSFSVLLATAACSGAGFGSKPDLEDARYWQRESASSALYMRGPKAQQMLHIDIATCTNDVRELERLGAIRAAMPTNYESGNDLEQRTAKQPERDQLNEWDTPERDGYLFSEHLDFSDFETCMISKGWERVNYMTNTAVDRSREAYLENMGYNTKKGAKGNRENVTSLDPAAQNPPPFNNVNE